MATDERDAASRIREQHSVIRQLFTDVMQCSADRRAETFEPLVRLLAVHETAEEEIVYPAVSAMGESAATLVKERRAEEDQAKKVLAKLEGLDAPGTEFMTELTAFHEAVEQHAQNEELHILPLLEKMEPDKQASMGKLFAAAEAMAPTHAHRMAPESAVGNMLVGPFVAMIDRVRDAIHDARH
jgi:hemerythrin superfamily protein